MIDAGTMLGILSEAQQKFISQETPREAFDGLLTGLLKLTGSEYGFIGVVQKTAEGAPYLKTNAITNIAWDDATRQFYEQNAPQGMEFFNLDSLFGEVIKTGQIVIANDPANDPRRTGLPEGHPPLSAFLGLPVYRGDELIGMIGIANRTGGYTEQLISALEPFLNTCANLISAYRYAMQAEIKTQQLKDSESRHRAILDTVVDGIITIDDQAVVASFNPAAENIFGYKAEEVIGHKVNMLMPGTFAAEHDSYMHNYLTTGKAQIIGIGREVTGLRKDGSTFPMDLAVSEMRIGSETMFSGIVRDITERKRVETMKNEFISTVSHELRTPLTSIRGSLDLLSGGAVGELPAEAGDMLTIATNNTERLLILINDILDIQKIESGKMAFRFERLNLNIFLERTIRDNQAYADQYGVQLMLKPPESDMWVFADKDRLTQVMANLLSNAVKFSPPNDVVEISTARHVDATRISITDHGPGIPDDFKPILFEKFTQSDSSDSRQKGGTGLGLNIARLIVKKHGGRIDFISQQNLGTTFYFELPELRDMETNLQLPSALKKDHAPCILIVEDDPDVAALLQRMLVEAGFNSDIAYSAQQARSYLKDHGDKYKAMTLDLNLPDQDGLDMLIGLRADSKTIDLPVVVVSIKADESRRELNGGAIGIMDWLNKPIDQERLKKTVKMAAGHGSIPRILHVEDDQDVHAVVNMMLRNECEMVWATSIAASREALETENFDMVLLDIGLPDGSGLDLLNLIEERVKPPRIIIFSAQEVDESVAQRVNSVLVKSQTSNEALLATIVSTMRNPEEH